MDVSPDGSVHVMWGDMRDSPNQARYHIYYTRSDDEGETFGFVNEELDIRAGDTRVTDFASNPNYAFPSGLFIGDYFSIDATDEDVYMVWADARLGEFGPDRTRRSAFARQQAVPSPEIFISPPAGPGGQQVTLQGFDFQPDMDVFVQLGDSTISQLRTDLDGGFTAQHLHAHHERGQPDHLGLRRVGQRRQHVVLHRVRLRQHPRSGSRTSTSRLDDL